MKTIVSIAFFLAGICCHAQSPGLTDSTIELRFQLIEKTSSAQLALAVEVINHSDKDLYIPNISSLTFHLYQQSEGGWQEIDFYTHRHYPPGEKMAILHPTDLRGFENEVNRYYKDSVNQFYHSQNAIIAEY
jgi:hypothetical protein